MVESNNELPHDLLAEKAFIGCLLVDSGSFDEVSDLRIHRDDFYHNRYGIIFDIISDLTASNCPVDYVSVHSKLAERGLLANIGGQSFLVEIVEDQASSANIYYYAKTVKEKSSLRNIIKSAYRVAEMGKTYKGNVGDFIQEVEAEFFRLTNVAKAGSMQKLNVFLKENLNELQDASMKPGDTQGLSTGYNKLDEFLLGMRPGQLIVLAARPAMGKTSLALNIAHWACEKSGLPVAIFSLEMTAAELSMRMLTSEAKVDSKKVRTKNYSSSDLRRIGDAVTNLSTLPVFINDSGSSTIADIQSQCRKIKADQGLGLVVVDYLQLMGSHDRSLPREQQISEMSRGLKNMAKELECPVMALSQLNRGVESRPNKRPNNADLRESGAIEQDADVVMFVYRDEVYNAETREPGIAEIIVGKNRSGETGLAKLRWVGQYTSFENIAHNQEPQLQYADC